MAGSAPAQGSASGSKQVRSGSNLGDSSRRAELALKRFTYHLAQRAAAATARRARRLEPVRGGGSDSRQRVACAGAQRIDEWVGGLA